MRVRIRGPSGQSTASLDDGATVQELYEQITQKTQLSAFDIKYGYPPKPLDLSQLDTGSPVAEAGVNLNGEQLIITRQEGSASQPKETTTTTTTTSPQQQQQQQQQPPGGKNNAAGDNDPPEIASPDHSGTIVLRIMPDDNSCLFRAVGSAVLGDIDAMTEMRAIVAQTIQEQQDVYSAAVLERRPDDYCRWIQTEDAWGGGIELGILSKHFDIEICSIDVQTLRADRFNEGRPTRCIVVYSGIHYDTVALSPSDPPFERSDAPAEFDTKIFDAADPVVLERAVELCQQLQKKHYYTDTAGFQVKCNTCGGLFVGEKGASRHAAQTGHYDFGEAA